MHCGWIPRSEWRDARPGDGNPRPPEYIGAGIDSAGVPWTVTNKSTGERFPDVCPGWAARQPLIVEACQAYKAFDKCALNAAFPDIDNVLIEAILELSRAFDEYQRQEMAASRKRQERDNG